MAASDWGRVAAAFGDPKAGLNIQTVRDAVSVMSSPPVGDRKASVILGPVDRLTQEGVIDALLKTIEEGDPRAPRAYLWAHDLGSVRSTIRSRCLLEWCPGVLTVDRKLLEFARSVVDTAIRGSHVGLIEVMAELKEDWKDSAAEFKLALAQVLSEQKHNPKALSLWERYRPLFLRHGPISYNEMVVGLLS